MLSIATDFAASRDNPEFHLRAVAEAGRLEGWSLLMRIPRRVRLSTAFFDSM